MILKFDFNSFPFIYSDSTLLWISKRVLWFQDILKVRGSLDLILKNKYGHVKIFFWKMKIFQRFFWN